MGSAILTSLALAGCQHCEEEHANTKGKITAGKASQHVTMPMLPWQCMDNAGNTQEMQR